MEIFFQNINLKNFTIVIYGRGTQTVQIFVYFLRVVRQDPVPI